MPHGDAQREVAV